MRNSKTARLEGCRGCVPTSEESTIDRTHHWLVVQATRLDLPPPADLFMELKEKVLPRPRQPSALAQPDGGWSACLKAS